MHWTRMNESQKFTNVSAEEQIERFYGLLSKTEIQMLYDNFLQPDAELFGYESSLEKFLNIGYDEKWPKSNY